MKHLFLFSVFCPLKKKRQQLAQKKHCNILKRKPTALLPKVNSKHFGLLERKITPAEM